MSNSKQTSTVTVADPEQTVRLVYTVDEEQVVLSVRLSRGEGIVVTVDAPGVGPAPRRALQIQPRSDRELLVFAW